MLFQAMICPYHFENLGKDWRWDGETLTKANGFLYQFVSSSYLVCFRILLEVLSYLKGITLKLHAYEEVDSVASTLKNLKRKIRASVQQDTEANKQG